MRRISLLVTMLCVLKATGLQADTKTGTEQNPTQLPDTIVVTANRSQTPLREIASSITIITAEQIERSQEAMVTDLLRRVPGLDVVQQGGPGQKTAVFLRGANSHHTLVIVDGIKMNDPSDPNGAFNMANLAAQNIERIEILRGPQSVLYGSEAIGGVIQVFTKQGRGRPSVNVSLDGGTFNTYHGDLLLSGQHQGLNYSASLTRRNTDGISATGRRSDDFEADGYGNTTVSTSLGYQISPDVRLQFSGRYADSDADLDKGFGLSDDPDYILTSKEKAAGLRMLFGNRERSWRQQVGFSFTDYERSTIDKFDSDHPADAEATHYDGSRIKFDWQHTLRVNQDRALILGAEVDREQFSQELHFTSKRGTTDLVIPEVDAMTLSVFALDRMKIRSHWFATVGLRLDNHEQFGSVGTFRVTTAYHIDDIGLKLKGTWGSGFKAPSLYQLYDSTFGNPDLQPERSRGVELGAEEHFLSGDLQFGATWFSNWFKDLIVSAANVDRAKSRGVEAFAQFHARRTSFRLDYTYTHSRDEADDKPLIRRPTHKVSLSVQLQPVERLALNLVGRHVGRRDDFDFALWPAKRISLAEYEVVDISAALNFGERLQLLGRINNLFDADYVEVYTYGTAPRAAYVGLKTTI